MYFPITSKHAGRRSTGQCLRSGHDRTNKSPSANGRVLGSNERLARPFDYCRLKAMAVPLPMAHARVERRDAAANRARILLVARRLLKDEGFNAVSVDRIAAEANVGKGTIFRRFGDRAGLMRALMDVTMREFQDAFLGGPPPLGPGAPPTERLEAFVDAFLEWLDIELEVALAAEKSATLEAGVVGEALALHVRGLITAIDQELDADVLATMLLGALNPHVIAVLRLRGASLEDQKAAARALLRGLTADA